MVACSVDRSWCGKQTQATGDSRTHNAWGERPQTHRFRGRHAQWAFFSGDGRRAEIIGNTEVAMLAGDMGRSALATVEKIDESRHKCLIRGVYEEKSKVPP